MTNLRDQILLFEDTDAEIVEVPQWGGLKIEMRSPTAGERMRSVRDSIGDDGEADITQMQGTMIALCAFDPDTGEKLFTVDDVDALNAKAAGPINDLFVVAQRLSGLSNDVEAGKDD